MNYQKLSFHVKTQSECVWFSLLDQEILNDMLGPSTTEQWIYWKHQTDEHRQRQATKNELEKLLSTEVTYKSVLNDFDSCKMESFFGVGIYSASYETKMWHKFGLMWTCLAGSEKCLDSVCILLQEYLRHWL